MRVSRCRKRPAALHTCLTLQYCMVCLGLKVGTRGASSGSAGSPSFAPLPHTVFPFPVQPNFSHASMELVNRGQSTELHLKGKALNQTDVRRGG